MKKRLMGVNVFYLLGLRRISLLPLVSLQSSQF